MLTVEMVECSMSTRREETMSMPSVFGALFAATVGVRVASSQADRCLGSPAVGEVLPVVRHAGGPAVRLVAVAAEMARCA